MTAIERPGRAAPAAARGALALMIALCLQGVVVGCHKTIPLATPIVVRQTVARELAIRNDLQQPITVLPSLERRREAPIVVAPGEAAKVPFRLEEIARLEPLDPGQSRWQRRYRLGAAASTLAAPPAGGTPYVRLQGVDGLVRIRFDDRTYDYLILLDEACLWDDPPAEGFVLPVTGPPDAGVPVSVCP